MLNMKGTAKVTSVSLRKEYHGEDTVKALTLKLELESIDVSVVEAAFVSQLSLVYDKDGDPALTELQPLKVSRKIDNVRVKIGGATLHGMDVKGVVLDPKPGRKVDVTLKVNGLCPDGVIDSLHDALMEEVEVSMLEAGSKQDAQAA